MYGDSPVNIDKLTLASHVSSEVSFSVSECLAGAGALAAAAKENQGSLTVFCRYTLHVYVLGIV